MKLYWSPVKIPVWSNSDIFIYFYPFFIGDFLSVPHSAKVFLSIGDAVIRSDSSSSSFLMSFLRLEFLYAVLVCIILSTYCWFCFFILDLSNYWCWGLQKFSFSFRSLLLNYKFLGIDAFGLSILRVLKFLFLGEIN